jgi:hypothetical protein
MRRRYHGPIENRSSHTERNVAAIDVSLLKSDTPGVTNVLHFNNAGAALPPRLDAVASQVAREAAIGGYEAGDCIADVCDAVSTLIGAATRRQRARPR